MQKSFKFLVLAGAAAFLTACSSLAPSSLEQSLDNQPKMSSAAIQLALVNAEGRLEPMRRDGTNRDRNVFFGNDQTLHLRGVAGKPDYRDRGTFEDVADGNRCLAFASRPDAEPRCQFRWPAAYTFDEDNNTFTVHIPDEPARLMTDPEESAIWSSANDELCLTFQPSDEVVAKVEAGEMEMPDPRVECFDVFATSDEDRLFLRRNENPNYWEEEYRTSELALES